jgi:hypothetical protein
VEERLLVYVSLVLSIRHLHRATRRQSPLPREEKALQSGPHLPAVSTPAFSFGIYDALTRAAAR